MKLPPSNLRGQGWPAAEDTCWTVSINRSPARGRCLDRPAQPRGATRRELVLHALQAQVHAQVMRTSLPNEWHTHHTQPQEPQPLCAAWLERRTRDAQHSTVVAAGALLHNLLTKSADLFDRGMLGGLLSQ